jgi:hypothetical protein
VVVVHAIPFGTDGGCASGVGVDVGVGVSVGLGAGVGLEVPP